MAGGYYAKADAVGAIARFQGALFLQVGRQIGWLRSRLECASRCVRQLIEIRVDEAPRGAAVLKRCFQLLQVLGARVVGIDIAIDRLNLTSQSFDTAIERVDLLWIVPRFRPPSDLAVLRTSRHTAAWQSK